MRRHMPIFSLLALWIIVSGCAVYPAAPAYAHQAPPRVMVGAPEYLYVIPSYGVYFVPDISAEIFFVNGRWYYNARGVWYWGASYRGPWTYIEVRYIPRQLKKIPRDYRTKYRNEYYRVPYGHWEKRRVDLPPRSPQRSTPPYVQQFKNRVYLDPQDHDIVFHDGSWYRKYKGVWYEGKSAAGPWRYKEMASLPKPIKKLPPGYRNEKPKKPYKQVPWPKVEQKYRKKIEKRDREWGK